MYWLYILVALALIIQSYLLSNRSKSSEGQEDDSRFLVELEKEMRRREDEEHHEEMKAGNLSQATFVLTLEEKEEEMTILNQGIRQSELEEMVLKEEDLKLLHQQKLLQEEVSRGAAVGCYDFKSNGAQNHSPH